MTRVHALHLLVRMRQGPMRRGAGSKTQARCRQEIADELNTHGVPDDLARRIALQLALKMNEADLTDRALWPEMGRILRDEATLVATRVGLSDKQIAIALPKLSAQQILDLHCELMTADRTIARTILNASLTAADPIETGRRYLAEYQNVLKHLDRIDPLIARTLANATFTASAPRKKAMEFMGRFAEVLATFQGDIQAARRAAKATYRASDRCQAAEALVADYDAAVSQLVKSGVDLSMARTLAGLKRIRDADANLAVGGELHPISRRPYRLSRTNPADRVTD